MSGSFAAMHSASGSFLDRWARRWVIHPDIFDCGVRVLDGQLAHERRRWSTRRSAVDPLVLGGIVELNHGTRARLRLLLDPHPFADGIAWCPGGAVSFCAIEQRSNALVRLRVPTGELYRFGLVLP